MAGEDHAVGQEDVEGHSHPLGAGNELLGCRAYWGRALRVQLWQSPGDPAGALLRTAVCQATACGPPLPGLGGRLA